MKSFKNKKCWYEGELNEELSKRRKGQHLNSEKKAYMIRLMTNFPQSHENIKRAYKISTSSYNKLKKVDEYSHCSDTLIVQENQE